MKILTAEENRVVISEKHSAHLISFVKFDGQRCEVNANEVSAIALDFDKSFDDEGQLVKDGAPFFETIAPRIAHLDYVVHTTHSHSRTINKYRVIIPFTRPVTPDEWPRVWDACNKLVGGIADPQTRNIQQPFFLPSSPAECRDIAFSRHHSGRLLNPDELLSGSGINFLPSSTLALNAAAINGISNGPPDMTQGFSDGHRTKALTQRAGYCLGVLNMTEDETVETCLKWNMCNDEQLPITKIEETVASLAKK